MLFTAPVESVRISIEGSRYVEYLPLDESTARCKLNTHQLTHDSWFQTLTGGSLPRYSALPNANLSGGLMTTCYRVGGAFFAVCCGFEKLYQRTLTMDKLLDWFKELPKINRRSGSATSWQIASGRENDFKFDSY